MNLAKSNKDNSFAEKGGFILGTIRKKIFLGTTPFSFILSQMSDRLGFEPGELLYAEKILKAGTSKVLYFYRPADHGTDPVPLDKISNISKVLNENVLYSPFFFLYLNRKSSKKEDYHELRRKIGTEIGHCIVDYISDQINSFMTVDALPEKNRPG